MADIQIRNGARENSTLNSADFKDGSLNALGKAKLQDILVDRDPGDMVVIYVDGGEPLANHRGAIDRYLASNHLFQGSIDVREGPNPRFATPAAKSLSDLAKADKSFHSTTPGEAEASYSPSPAATPPGSSR